CPSEWTRAVSPRIRTGRRIPSHVARQRLRRPALNLITSCSRFGIRRLVVGRGRDQAVPNPFSSAGDRVRHATFFAGHRGEDPAALLALADVATELAPGVEPSDLGRGRAPEAADPRCRPPTPGVEQARRRPGSTGLAHVCEQEVTPDLEPLPLALLRD